MRIQGHAAEGIIVGAVTILVTHPEPAVADRVLLLSGIAGALPDFDALIYMAKRKTFKMGTDFHHHTWVTHTFPFYLVPTAIGYWIGQTTGHPYLTLYSLVFGMCTCLHLLQDMWGSGDGIMAQSPFSRRMIGWALTGTHGPEWQRDYMRGPVYKVELAANTLAILIVAGYALMRFTGYV